MHALELSSLHDLHRELHYWCWVNTRSKDREFERTVPANPKRTNMHELKLRGLPLLLTRERLCRLRWLRCCRLWRKILRNSNPGPASHDYHDPEALRPALHPSDFILARRRKTKASCSASVWRRSRRSCRSVGLIPHVMSVSLTSARIGTTYISVSCGLLQPVMEETYSSLRQKDGAAPAPRHYIAVDRARTWGLTLATQAQFCGL